MFNIFSWQHVLILTVIALVVVGPKDLPRLMRMAADWATKGRSMASSLRRNFDDLTRTTDLDGLRTEMNALKRKHSLSSLEAAVDDRDFRG
jgi:sec-independent protein translocase protein TatB